MKISNAAYPSPNIRYDPIAQVVIFERRNPDTGVVTFQTPSRATIRQQKDAAVTRSDQATAALAPARAPASPPQADVPTSTPRAAPTAPQSPHISLFV